MNAFLLLVGSSVGGALGWWAGEKVGIMTAYLLSVVGTAGGVYAVRRWINQYQP